VNDVSAPLPEEALWDANRAARFLGVSRSWIYRETSAGRVPCYRILGLLRFDPADLKAWVERQKVQPVRLLNPIR
jgi:excisionase family DNA binding protein